MLTILIVILTIPFALAGIGPYLATDETSAIFAKKEYRVHSPEPCSER